MRKRLSTFYRVLQRGPRKGVSHIRGNPCLNHPPSALTECLESPSAPNVKTSTCASSGKSPNTNTSVVELNTRRLTINSDSKKAPDNEKRSKIFRLYIKFLVGWFCGCCLCLNPLKHKAPDYSEALSRYCRCYIHLQRTIPVTVPSLRLSRPLDRLDVSLAFSTQAPDTFLGYPLPFRVEVFKWLPLMELNHLPST